METKKISNKILGGIIFTFLIGGVVNSSQGREFSSVKWFNNEKGYGFIQSSQMYGGGDVFVHFKPGFEADIFSAKRRYRSRPYLKPEYDVFMKRENYSELDFHRVIPDFMIQRGRAGNFSGFDIFGEPEIQAMKDKKNGELNYIRGINKKSYFRERGIT